MRAGGSSSGARARRDIFPIPGDRVGHGDPGEEAAFEVDGVERRRIARIVVRPEHTGLRPAHRQSRAFAQLGRQRSELLENPWRVRPPLVEVRGARASRQVLARPTAAASKPPVAMRRSGRTIFATRATTESYPSSVPLAYREERAYAALGYQ